MDAPEYLPACVHERRCKLLNSPDVPDDEAQHQAKTAGGVLHILGSNPCIHCILSRDGPHQIMN